MSESISSPIDFEWIIVELPGLD